jgi:hypothetical protein
MAGDVMDFDFNDHGSICLLTPLTPKASCWVEDHLDPDGMTWGQCSVVIEPRYVQDILDGIADDGLTVRG